MKSNQKLRVASIVFPEFALEYAQKTTQDMPWDPPENVVGVSSPEVWLVHAFPPKTPIRAAPQAPTPRPLSRVRALTDRVELRHGRPEEDDGGHDDDDALHAVAHRVRHGGHALQNHVRNLPGTPRHVTCVTWRECDAVVEEREVALWVRVGV